MLLVQKKHRDQWNRIQNPKINPHIYGQSTKDTRLYNEEKIVSLINGAGQARQLHREESN